MALKLSTGMRNQMLGLETGTLDAKSFRLLFEDGFLHIYSGSQPTDANSAETGTKLVEIGLSASPTTGIEFGDAASGAIGKATAETWSGTASATGTAGYFRFYDSESVTGASTATTCVRFDGAIATSGAELNMSNTSITSGSTVTIDTFTITLPAT